MIDNVNKFTVSNMTTITERDFRGEYLFRTCSVATILVTSQEFNPIRCAIMLCHFGQTRSSYVAIPCTAASIARGNYVAIPEHFGQNEEPASRNEEYTRKKPNLVPKVK